MPINSLPSQITPFIGRETELAEIVDLLATPTCRLLTLTGPGGIGKTRLALEAARSSKVGSAFTNGVYFVPLQPVNTPDFIVSAIADKLQFVFSGDQDTKTQLLHFLGDKCLLLLLDNFEHLLEGVDLLIDILHAAPGVKFLVTSRERLNVQEEWLLTIDGLHFPHDQSTAPLESYSAVQLFVQRARQVLHNFSLQTNADAIQIICQQVEGMPLGLELAATWLRVLSCRQIAAQMGTSLDFLTTSLHNVPQRHRSLRAVFEQSWNLLSAGEQAVLMQLSVFQGGFDLQAAEQVAGASLSILASLVGKSLIRLNADERYDLHDLLRQFLVDKLLGGENATSSKQSHLEYFLILADQAEANIYGPQQISWLNRLEIELNNIRAALIWSLESGEVEPGLRLATALFEFWIARGHHREGFAWSERFLAVADAASPSIRAKALYRAGQLAASLGDEERAIAFCTEALAVARHFNDRRNIAWALLALGTCTDDEQTFTERAVLVDESMVLFREIEDAHGLCCALDSRAIEAMLNQGDYLLARRLLDEAWTCAREADDKSDTASVLHAQGLLLLCQDTDYSQSAALFEASISLFLQLGDKLAALHPMVMLGRVEQLLQHNRRAQVLYEEALTHMREKGGYDPVKFFFCLAGLGILMDVEGQPERAARLLGAAAGEGPFGYPAFPAKSFNYQVDSVCAQLGENVFASAWAEGLAMTREQAIAYALWRETSPTGLADGQAQAVPLTERELEILHLLASGLNSREIAESLILSVNTIRWYLKEIYSKLDAHNRTQAVAHARAMKLLT